MMNKNFAVVIIIGMITLCGIAVAQEFTAGADSDTFADTTPPVPPLTSVSTPAPHRPPSKGATKELSLQEVLQKAMKDDPNVRIEQIRTDAAMSLVREHEIGIFDPRVTASYRGSASERQRFSESHNLSLGVTGNYLPTGTRVEAGIIEASPQRSLRRIDTVWSGGVVDRIDTVNNRYQNAIGITVTQALLQGFGNDVNLVPLRKARLDVDIRREEMTAYAQRLIADVERAYWDLLFSGEQMSIYKYSLDLARRLLYETEERLKYGSAAPIDLVAIQAEVASRERQLYDAEVAYRQKELYLVYAMNSPEYWDVDLVLTDTLATLGSADAVSDHIAAAVKFRPDYRQASILAQRGELDLVLTNDGMRPKLNLFFSVRGVSPTETFPRALLPTSRISGEVSGGLTLDFPIRSAAAREQHRRTQFSIEQQKLSIENFARVIEHEVRAAHIDVERARRQVETSATVSGLQLRKLEAEQMKMDAGKSTGYAVLQVQRDVVAAHLDEAQARTAYINALITLFSRDGTLLTRRGIKTD